MIYRLITEDCAWSLVKLKAPDTNVCCLNHCGDKRIPDGWHSTVKYDPDSDESSPYDINVDTDGNIVMKAQPCPGSSARIEKTEQSTSETIRAVP